MSGEAAFRGPHTGTEVALALDSFWWRRIARGLAGTPKAIPYQRDEVLIQPVFRDATPRTRAQGLFAGFVPLVSRRSDNAGGRIDFEDSLKSRDSRARRKIQVH